MTFNSMQEFVLCISGVDCIEDVYAALNSERSIDWVIVLLWIPLGIKVISPDGLTHLPKMWHIHCINCSNICSYQPSLDYNTLKDTERQSCSQQWELLQPGSVKGQKKRATHDFLIKPNNNYISHVAYTCSLFHLWISAHLHYSNTELTTHIYKLI